MRSVRTREGQEVPAETEPLGPSLAQEIYVKYAGKTQPESRQLVAILAAVQEVVKAQGLEVTPTAMFAALMARYVLSLPAAICWPAGVMTVSLPPAPGVACLAAAVGDCLGHQRCCGSLRAPLCVCM